LVWALLASPAPAAPPVRDRKPTTRPAASARWEPHIRRFEQRDKKTPPPTGAVLFVGSSSIVGWRTQQCFPKLQTINRGFGGSQIADSLYFAGRIVIPYRPRAIVFYAGDNDVAARKTPETVSADFKAFAKKVHGALPKTKILYVAIKPSLRRWRLWEKMHKANSLIEAQCKTDDRLTFVDIAKPMLGVDGRPRKELFRSDGLHLSAEGYKLWTSLVRPLLAPADKAEK